MLKTINNEYIQNSGELLTEERFSYHCARRDFDAVVADAREVSDI